MATSFMSGLISGFMSTFGAGGGMGAMGGAGGASGAAGASSGAADAGGAASATGSSGASASTTGSAGAASTGGENVGTTSQALSTGGGGDAAGTPSTSSSGGSGDIIRQNPYGSDPNTGPSTSDYIKAGVKGYQQGSEQAKQNAGGIDNTPVTMPNNTYGALFGSSMNSVPMGQMAPQSFSPPPMATGGGATLTPPPSQPISPPPQAAPLPISQPNPGPYPVIQPQLGVSDMRAKRNIVKGNKDLERLLDNVYSNLQKKGKR